MASILILELIHYSNSRLIDRRNLVNFDKENGESHDTASTTTSITGVNDDPLKSYIKYINVCQQMHRILHKYNRVSSFNRGKKTKVILQCGSSRKSFNQIFFLFVLNHTYNFILRGKHAYRMVKRKEIKSSHIIAFSLSLFKFIFHF